MNDPLVSIIIPVYNGERYIETTVESAFNQTYANFEVIIVNDGSTDNTSAKLKDLKSKYPDLIVVSQSNAGVSVARNTGIEYSNGEYICFADADDILLPNYIEYLVSNAIKYDADISVSTGMTTNFKLGNLKVEDSKTDIIKVYDKEDSLIKMLTYWLPIGCYCRAFSRRLIDKGLTFIPNQKVGEGFTFNIKAILMANKMVIGNSPVYCYRRDNNESCMTSFKMAKAKEAIESIDIIGEILKDQDAKVQKAVQYARWHTIGDMYNWLISSGNKSNYPAESKSFYQEIKSFSTKNLPFKLNKRDRLRIFLLNINPNLLANLVKLRKYIGS